MTRSQWLGSAALTAIVAMAELDVTAIEALATPDRLAWSAGTVAKPPLVAALESARRYELAAPVLAQLRRALCSLGVTICHSAGGASKP